MASSLVAFAAAVSFGVFGFVARAGVDFGTVASFLDFSSLFLLLLALRYSVISGCSTQYVSSIDCTVNEAFGPLTTIRIFCPSITSTADDFHCCKLLVRVFRKSYESTPYCERIADLVNTFIEGQATVFGIRLVCLLAETGAIIV